MSALPPKADIRRGENKRGCITVLVKFSCARKCDKKTRSRHQRERGPDLTPMLISPEVGAYRKFYIFLCPVGRHRYKTVMMLQNGHFSKCGICPNESPGRERDSGRGPRILRNKGL
jgi:hypothetical protein